jgi:hypothetical protein
VPSARLGSRHLDSFLRFYPGDGAFDFSMKEHLMPHTSQHPITRHMKAEYRRSCGKVRLDVRFLEQASEDGTTTRVRRTYERFDGPKNGAPSFKQWMRTQGDGGASWFREKDVGRRKKLLQQMRREAQNRRAPTR